MGGGIGSSTRELVLVGIICLAHTDCESRVFVVGWLFLEGSGFDGVGDDFCDVSLGNNALYISFLRGFSVAMRNVFAGASEDDVFGVGRSGRGRFSSGSLRSPSGSGCTLSVAERIVSFGGWLDDAEGKGRGGFTNAGGSGLGAFVAVGASPSFSGGKEGFVALSTPRDLSGGMEGFVNWGGSGLCGAVAFDPSRGFSGGIEGFGGSKL